MTTSCEHEHTRLEHGIGKEFGLDLEVAYENVICEDCGVTIEHTIL